MISLNQVKKMRQGRVILNGINFNFLNNKHYVIFGESGIGKTTLLNLIAGYENADSGRIEYENEKKLNLQYLFQETLLFSKREYAHKMDGAKSGIKL